MENIDCIIQKIINYLDLKETPEEFLEQRKHSLCFTVVWNIFEDNCFGEPVKNGKLKNFVENNIDKLQFENCDSFNNLYAHFEDKFKQIDNDKFNYLFETLCPNETDKNKEIHINYTMSGIKTEYIDRLKAVIYLIFRLRNNLFHGKKGIIISKQKEETLMLINKFLIELTIKYKPSPES